MATRLASVPSRIRRRTRNWPGVIVISSAIIVAAILLARNQPTESAQASVPMVVAEYDTIAIPVPIDPVVAGTKVKDIRFRNLAFPRHQLPDGALSTVDSILESSAITGLPANLPLFAANFSSTLSSSNPVIERIPPGMRAMTIRVDATAAVEGWAGSGAMVDILLVMSDRTTVVAEKVRILSAERSVVPVAGRGAPAVPSTVTLLVTQDQCLAINTAIPLGKIAFALRSSRDQEHWLDGTYSAQRLRVPDVDSDVNRSTVTGYISVQVDDGKRSFALADGKWVQTELVPQGFLVGQEKR